jgi:hypothetical protein
MTLFHQERMATLHLWGLSKLRNSKHNEDEGE